MIVNEEIWERYRHIWGRPLDEAAHQSSLITYFHLDLADEARRLMARS